MGGTAKGWELGGPARIPEGVVRAETPVPGREERELSLSGLRWERSRPALWGPVPAPDHHRHWGHCARVGPEEHELQEERAYHLTRP